MTRVAQTNGPGSSGESASLFQVFVMDRAAPHSTRAVANLRRALDSCIRGEYELRVVDLRDEPEFAIEEQLIVIPAVVRKRPKPPVRLTGDFSDEARIIEAFDLHRRGSATQGSEA